MIDYMTFKKGCSTYAILKIIHLIVGYFFLTSHLAAMDGMGTLEENGITSPTIVRKSLSSLPIPSKSFEEIEKITRQQYPQYFSDIDKLDEVAVENYRTNWFNFTGKSKDIFLSLHNPTLLPFLKSITQYLEDFAKEHSQYDEIINRFIREIQFYQEIECVSLSWFDKLPFRFLCATSTMSLPERDFISHLTEPHPSLFFALQENEAWKNHESSVKSMDRYDDRTLGLPSYKYFILAPDTVKKIEECIEKALPLQTTCGLWGTSELGIAFIVKAMLNDIFLVGVPIKNLSAHGIPLSPFGFGVHDLFHKSVDHRRFKFIQHVIDLGEKYVANGGSLQKFLSLFLPPTLNKYRGIMDSLQEIYQRLVCTFDQLDSQKAMLGFFWILHEEPCFPSILYTVRNFDDILKIITEDEGETDTPTNITRSTEKITAGVDLRDHFETSPLDGTSQWNDEKIIEWVVRNKKVREARKYELMGYDGHPNEFINRDDIVSQKVKRSPRYIDVSFMLRQGEELTYSFQTLFYNVQATHDALKILELIGIKTKLPDLLTTENPRVVAESFIRKGEEDINDLIIHFRKVASFFANEDIPGKGSLIQRYVLVYDSLEKEIIKALSEQNEECHVCNVQQKQEGPIKEYQ